jgi:cohesin complex subunit SA-1/2
MEDSITEDGASRRKSGRSIRKPDLFIEQQHEGSLLNNGSAKRKRHSNAATGGEKEDEVESSSTSEQESEGEADEEELREQRKAVRSRVSKSSSKRQKVANGVGGSLAIRSANIQSQAMSKAVKVQKARARQSQANQVGLYGQWLQFALLL